MSEKPFPENLISGYLDGQLTEEERALVEQSMQEDPATKRLVEELRANAEQMQGLPRFRTPEGFAERLMASPELDRAFSDLATDEVGQRSELSDESSAYPRTRRLRLAVAAIVSLAAMMLVTLFLPQSFESAKLQVQKSSETTESEPAREAFDAKKSSGLSKDNVALTNAVGQPVEMDALPEVAESLGDKRNSSKSKRSNRRFRDQKKSKSLSKMSNQQANSIVGDKDDSELSDRLPPVSPARQRFAADGDAGFGNGVDSNSAEQESAIVGDAQQQADRLSDSSSLAVNEVIEIEFAQVPDALVVFREALQRNQILLSETDSDLAIDDDSDRPGDTQGNDLSGSRSEEGVNLFETRKLDMLNSSHAFVVTATPAQMVRLFSDVGQRATINRFPLGKDSSRNDPVANENLAMEDESDQAEKSTAQMELLAREKAKDARQAVRGFAKQLERRQQQSLVDGVIMHGGIGGGQAIGEPGADLPAKEPAKALGQPKEDLYSYYFENADKDQPRRFLLFVRSSNTAGR